MNDILSSTAKLLGRLGLGRRVLHVDAGAAVHVCACVVDGATGASLSGVEVSIEGSKDPRATEPLRRPAGQSDEYGQVDATVLIRWSYLSPTLAHEPAPPRLAAVAHKTGFRDERVFFDLPVLPTVRGVKQLDLGRLTMTRV